MKVRKANSCDVIACVDLVEARRLRYEEYEPQFWKRADGSREITVEWFTKLFSEVASLSLVATEESTVVGFLIARDAPVPPVYNPGGLRHLLTIFVFPKAVGWTLAIIFWDELKKNYVKVVGHSLLLLERIKILKKHPS